MSRSREPPIRIAWAVDLLDLTPGDRVFEVGCGPGVAASLVADRLVDGHTTAIDRSPTAIVRARARNGDHLASGRLALEQTTTGDVWANALGERLSERDDLCKAGRVECINLA